MVPRPSRPSAETFEVTEELYQQVKLAITAEEETNDLLDVVGLTFPDGDAVFVTHLSRPYKALSKEARDATYDENTIRRCMDAYRTCVRDNGEGECAEPDACIRTAYTDDYAYGGHYLLMDCGILHLSRYAKYGNKLRLLDRVVLEVMACDFESSRFVPAATDVDLDHGPELAFAYVLRRVEPHHHNYIDTLTIVDAADLHVQAHLQMSLDGETRLIPMEQDGPLRGIGTAILADRTGDGLPDLVRKQFVAVGEFCPASGWTANPDLLLLEGHEAEGCQVAITETILPYDPAKDVWTDAEKTP